MSPTSTPLYLTAPVDTPIRNSGEYIELIKITQEIISLNADYLTIAVSIILFAGGFFYLFNFRPLEERFKKQEEKIESDRSASENKLNELRQSVVDYRVDAFKRMSYLKKAITKQFQQKQNDLDGRMKIIEEKAIHEIQTIKRRSQLAELQSLWDSHYLWNTGSLIVEENCLSTLIRYLEVCNEYNNSVTGPDLLLETINISLDNLSKKIPDKESVQYRSDMYKRLDSAVSKSTLFSDTQKKVLMEKSFKILLGK